MQLHWNVICVLFCFVFSHSRETERKKRSLKAVDTTLNCGKCLGKEKEKEATLLPTQR